MTLTKEKRTKSVTNIPVNGDIKVIDSSEVPQFTRGSKYDPILEKFKTLKLGQAIMLDLTTKTMTTSLYSYLKKRKVENFAIKQYEGKVYLIKK